MNKHCMSGQSASSYTPGIATTDKAFASYEFDIVLDNKASMHVQVINSNQFLYIALGTICFAVHTHMKYLMKISVFEYVYFCKRYLAPKLHTYFQAFSHRYVSDVNSVKHLVNMQNTILVRDITLLAKQIPFVIGMWYRYIMKLTKIK